MDGILYRIEKVEAELEQLRQATAGDLGHVAGAAAELADTLRERETLRDRFAGQAMVGLLTHHRGGVPELFWGITDKGTLPHCSVEEGLRRAAALAYEAADALLEAR